MTRTEALEAVTERLEYERRDAIRQGAAAERENIVAWLDQPKIELVDFCARNIFGLEDNDSDGSDGWEDLTEEQKKNYRDFAHCVCRAVAAWIKRGEREREI
jgi:hypothetical protein